eukprot:4172993-Amphidinium_carterae.1
MRSLTLSCSAVTPLRSSVSSCSRSAVAALSAFCMCQKILNRAIDHIFCQSPKNVVSWEVFSSPLLRGCVWDPRCCMRCNSVIGVVFDLAFDKIVECFLAISLSSDSLSNRAHGPTQRGLDCAAMFGVF